MNNIQVWNRPEVSETMGTGVHEQLLREKDGLQLQVSVDTEKLESGLASSEFSKEAWGQIVCVKFPVNKALGQVRLKAGCSPQAAL